MKVFIIGIAVTLCLYANAQNGYRFTFNDNVVDANIEEVAYDFDLVENEGYLKIGANGSGPGWGNVEFSFNSINISDNPTLKIKAYTNDDVNIRIDLVGGNGNTSSGSPVEFSLTASEGEVELNIDLSDKFGAVEASDVKGFVMFLNAGGNFTGEVFVDQIEIGDASQVTNFTYHLNQVGYDKLGTKSILLNSPQASIEFTEFTIINSVDEVVFTGDLEQKGSVETWGTGYYWNADFSNFQGEGVYRLQVGPKVSNEFEIAEDLLFNKSAESVIGFFTGMRSDDPADYTLSFHGDRNDEVDVHGGWWDANGDPGKHMSHLSYANYFNPQQIPMVVWSLLKSYELAYDQAAGIETQLFDEAAFGADYIVKNHDPEGYFYLAIFDDWGGAPFSREICEWGLEGDNSARSANYQCAFREGGGLAIAALARAYYMNLSNGDFTPQEYLQTAIDGYAHLNSPGNGYATKNLEYCNDHTENIIDDYCALLAAIELFKATKQSSYYEDALYRTDRLLSKLQPEGWLASDDEGNRPFYHAADEGLPLLSLVEFKNISTERNTEIQDFIASNLAWYKQISSNVSNPFNYIRQYQKPYVDGALGEARESFFVPQENETGYWWQGENARLASMTTAILLANSESTEGFELENNEDVKLAMSQLDWILGKNPFDICMLYGFGTKTYESYFTGLGNVHGGICNGITSAVGSNEGITYMPYDQGGEYRWQNWRWIEQWLPHDAWFMLAVSSISHLNNNSKPVASFAQTVTDEDCSSFNVNYITSQEADVYAQFVFTDGDIDSSTALDIDVFYEDEGEYTTSLYVENIKGSDASEQTVNLEHPAQCSITGLSGAENDMLVYPNPFKDGLRIELPEYDYRIISSTGQVVEAAKGNNNSVVGKNLPKGIYQIEINDHESIRYLNIVKE